MNKTLKIFLNSYATIMILSYQKLLNDPYFVVDYNNVDKFSKAVRA